MDMWSYEQDFHGDSWVGGDDGGGDGGAWGPDLPGEADTFGGGEIEMQVLGGTKSTAASTAPSFVDTDPGQQITPFGEGPGTSLSGIKGFVRNRLIDVVGGQLLMPMFNWLDARGRAA